MENPVKMDDLGVPLFLETSIYIIYTLYSGYLLGIFPFNSFSQWASWFIKPHIDIEIGVDMLYTPGSWRITKKSMEINIYKNEKNTWEITKTFWGRIPLQSLRFGVTLAEVAINCRSTLYSGYLLGIYHHFPYDRSVSTCRVLTGVVFKGGG